MAQRLYQQFQKTLVREVVSVFADFSTDGAGDVVSLQAKNNIGIKSITRVPATGIYTIVLGSNSKIDKYAQLLFVDILGVAILSGIPYYASQIIEDRVAIDGSLKIAFTEETSIIIPTEINFLIEIKLKNSKN